jgi:hypothetical protein
LKYSLFFLKKNFDYNSYFECEPMYGLFAPIQKVQPFSESAEKEGMGKPSAPSISGQSTHEQSSVSKNIASNSSAVATKMKQPMASASKLARPGTVAGISTDQRLNKDLSGSQESLVSEKSSIYSTASAAAAKQQTQQQLQQSLIKTVKPVKTGIVVAKRI